jgi:hypothetical protein
MGVARHRWLGAFCKSAPVGQKIKINMKNNKSDTFFSVKVIIILFFSFSVLGGGVFLQSAHADNGVLAITQISPVQTYASADGTYANGWKWTFNITVPANETVFQMEFSDWTGSSSTIPAANDIQFYSAQSMNASNEAQAIPITASGTYSAPMYLNPSSDLSTSTAGNQIQITLEARVPVGSSGGSYSTSYGINTSFTAPTSTGANPPAITGVQSTNVTSGGATITWTTNGYSDSEVYFGTQSGVYSSSTSNSNTVSSGGNYTHSVTLSGLNASTTYYYEVASADNSGDIGVSSGYSFVTQTFPIGSLTVTQNSGLGNQNVSAGTSDVEIGSYALSASSVEGVNVNSVSIQTNGDSDGVSGSPFQNLKAVVNGTQFGVTQGAVASGTAYKFNGTPFEISAGGAVDVNIYADISSSTPANTTASPATIITGLSGTGAISSGAVSIANPVSGQNISFNQGNLVISKDASSPTTYAVAGNTNQVLAKFDVLASGESIKFNEMDFNVFGGNAINNFRIVDDQGAQIGTTVNLAAGSTTVAEGSGSLNYIIPANTTRVLTVYGDLLSTASGTVQVSIGGDNTSAQNYTTSVSVGTISPVSGNTLTVLASNSNLSVKENYGLGSPVSAAVGASNVEIGSYTFTAGQVNGINLTGVTINVTSTLPNNYLTNLAVMDGSTQIGTTYATVVGGTSYSFNGSTPIAISANGSITLNVYANISSNVVSSTYSSVTTLASVNASTQAGNAVTVTPTPGQNITFNDGGILNGSLSAGTSQASYLGMGVIGVNVAQYQFVADNNGSETVTQLKIVDSSTTGSITTSTKSSDLINYRLTDSSGNLLSTASEGSTGLLTFNLSGVTVPVNSTQYLNLVADTNSYPYATSGDAHAYALESFNYTNASQATTTNVSTNNIGNLFTVYQTTLSVTGTSGWSTPPDISGVGNTIGEFTFTAGSGNMNPVVKTLTLSTGGSLLQSSTTQTLGLYDASAPSVLLASSTLTGTGSVTFNLQALNSNQWTIPYSSTKTLLIKTLLSPTNLVALANGNTGSYQILLAGLTWTDGPSGTSDITSNITSLSPSISMPIPSTNITGLSN